MKRPLAQAVAIALWQAAVVTAYADSGRGVDTTQANVLLPAGRPPSPTDPESSVREDWPLSPNGTRQAAPPLPRETTQTDSGWRYSGSAEVGALGVSGNATIARFLEYRDASSHFYPSYFGFDADKPEPALFFGFRAGGIGQKDGFYNLSAGQYGTWKLAAFANETPHTLTTSYRSLWNGVGSESLTLKTLPPGGLGTITANTNALTNEVLAAPATTLSVQRRKGGARAEVVLAAGLEAFAAYSREDRKGAQPFGMLMGAQAGGIDIPESIDSSTHDFSLGIQSFNDRGGFSIQGSGSFFRNRLASMRVQNPLTLPSTTAADTNLSRVATATYALAPSNDFYNLKADYTRLFPSMMNARLTAVASLSSSRQNEALLPMSDDPLTAVRGITNGSWNSTASLSQKSANARIDSKLLQLGLAFKPLDSTDVNAKWRHYETKNSTVYFACNPLTGQWGRVINNGSGSATTFPDTTLGNNPADTLPTAYSSARCNADAVRALGLVPNAGNVAIRNIPVEYTQDNAVVTVDTRINKDNKLTTTYEHEAMYRPFRDRASTWEDRLSLALVNKSISDTNVRITADTARLRGGDYNTSVYTPYFSANFGPAPTARGTNATLWMLDNPTQRAFDLADRDRTALNLRANYGGIKDVDIGLTALARNTRYPNSEYGRIGRQAQYSGTVDATWTVSPDLSITGFYAFQNDRLQQRGLQRNACVIGTTYYFYSDGSISTAATPSAAQIAGGISVIGSTAVTSANYQSVCGTPSPSSPLLPTSRAWTSTQRNTNHTLGLNLKHDFRTAKFDASYNYTLGKTKTSYVYNAAALGLVTSGAQTPTGTATLALIGDGFGDAIYRQHTFDASVLIPVSARASMRILGRYENGKVSDWHYDGVRTNPVPAANQQVYLDYGPQSYRAYLFGILYRYDF